MTSPRGSRKPQHMTWTNYLGRIWYVQTRVTKRGVKIYKHRTLRGRRQFTRIWAKRYPYLFTKEFLRSLKP